MFNKKPSGGAGSAAHPAPAGRSGSAEHSRRPGARRAAPSHQGGSRPAGHSGAPSRGFSRRGPSRDQHAEAPRHHLPPPARLGEDGKPILRFVPLGGFEEIGRNCSYFEYGNEIVVIDAGIQFPEESTPGIDYIIPNVSSLEPKKQNVAALILTHGHYDHIAAIHYLIEKLGNPIIYTSKFTKAIVERRHEEFTNAPKLRFQTVESGDRIKLSEHFTAEFFEVEHTIPEAYGYVLETPVGKIASFGDFRIDFDKDGNPRGMEVFEKLGAMGIHTVFMDSTNADLPGRAASEDTVEANIEALIKGSKGRVIVGMFASLVDRILEVIKIAERLGRKVAVNGRSMRSNLEIAVELGYLKENKGVLIPVEDVNKYKDDKVLILTTGSQGESNAGLMRIVNGEHRVVRLKDTDTVIFSSSVVPGNERSVQSLQDNIARQVDQLYNSKLLDIHVSGHVYHEDAKLVVERVKPRFIVPLHGYYFKRKSYQKIAEAIGMKREQVVLMDNGQVAELTADKFTVTKDTVPTSYVMVDGLGVGDVEEIVIRDRRNLAQEGMMVIITTLDRHGKLLKNPDIISRGFIHLKDNAFVIDEVRKRLRALLERTPHGKDLEPDYLKTLIRDQIGQFLYNKTKRRPMILPVIIEL